MYQEKDYVIYKKDLCQITKIETIKEKTYYTLKPQNDKTLSIKIPTTTYLKKPLSKEEALTLIHKLTKIPPLNINEKLLENEYKSLLKTNKHEDLIKIIKTTYLRNMTRKNSGKKESDKDTNFFEQAEKYLYTELAYSLNMTYDDCKNFILEEVKKDTTKENS